MAHIDTFDPKKLGNAKTTPKQAGSYYDSIETSVPGVRVCEHLAKVAPLADRLTIVRTVNHRVVDEHAFATNLVHTGRMINGNIVYPSIGSLVAHQRGAAASGVPAYMLIGYPNVSRGPGYLGAKYGYIYLTDTSAGPAGFTLPEYVSSERQGPPPAVAGRLSASGRAGFADGRLSNRANRSSAAGRAWFHAQLPTRR